MQNSLHVEQTYEEPQKIQYTAQLHLKHSLFNQLIICK